MPCPPHRTPSLEASHALAMNLYRLHVMLVNYSVISHASFEIYFFFPCTHTHFSPYTKHHTNINIVTHHLGGSIYSTHRRTGVRHIQSLRIGCSFIDRTHSYSIRLASRYDRASKSHYPGDTSCDKLYLQHFRACIDQSPLHF